MASFSSGYSSWELRSYHDPDAGEEASERDEDMDAVQCSAEFLHMLIQLKMSGALSANHVCLLYYWASRGGLTGAGGSLATPPGKVGDIQPKN